MSHSVTRGIFRVNLRSALALLLCSVLALESGCGGAPRAPRGVTRTPLAGTLPYYLQKSYMELFEEAEKLNFTAGQIQEEREKLRQGKEYCAAKYKERAANYGRQLEEAEKDLERTTQTLKDKERKEKHCRIEELRAVKSQAEVLAGHAIPTAYDNRAAKLDLIEKWPAEEKQIRAELASGAYHTRRWANVKDIGYRTIAEDQERDIKPGQEAVERLKSTGMLPKEIEDQVIVEYVTAVAERVAEHSDLRVPLHVTVLNSKEINAFALPGGFLFIERGLLEATDNETELAGVVAHELAHVTARHGHKLMVRATITSIFYQAAQVAAMILTGGASSIGMYYLLQYSFFGLGLVLDLRLLGVSRDFELEADQLGVQYAWNAGYDPRGFIQFFDKMATKEGYANGASWFRTHPPFYRRMVESQREILFLGLKEEMIEQTSGFEVMKKSLHKVTAQAQKDEKERPTLKGREKDCPPVRRLEYTPGQPIEALCLNGGEEPAAKPEVFPPPPAQHSPPLTRPGGVFSTSCACSAGL
jgi:Zn-dependent protease with chaperone function